MSVTSSYNKGPGTPDEGMLGQVVSHYRIQSKLGEGGMGVVFQALDLRLNRPVALKFLHPKLIHSREQIASLEKEALGISALNHSNVATIYGIEEAGKQKFIVLEYLRLRSRVAYYYSALGDKDSASREIAQALRLSPGDGYVLFRAAVVYEQFHNRDAAFDALQAALRTGYSAEEIRKEPILESLRADSRYKSLFSSKLNK